MAAFRVTNFSDEDLAIPSHHALPARYSLIVRLLKRGMGLFAMQSNRLGATALLLGSVASEKIDPADYSFAVKRRGGRSRAPFGEATSVKICGSTNSTIRSIVHQKAKYPFRDGKYFIRTAAQFP